jgi:hypothetical protein
MTASSFLHFLFRFCCRIHNLRVNVNAIDYNVVRHRLPSAWGCLSIDFACPSFELSCSESALPESDNNSPAELGGSVMSDSRGSRGSGFRLTCHEPIFQLAGD